METGHGKLIDWTDDRVSHWMIDPRLSEVEKRQAQEAKARAPELPGSIWIRSSGSTAMPKWIALSQQAFLRAAASVNLHLRVSSKDIWFKPLSDYHVGGLSIYARASLQGHEVVDLETWSPKLFRDLVDQRRVTLTSLVPTQVYDLVKLNLSCPQSLRACLIGGDRVSQSLYRRALELGWPLLPSYGATETCAMIACAGLGTLSELNFPTLEILSHATIAVTDQQMLKVFGESLFTGQMIHQGPSKGWAWKPRREPYVLMQDFVTINENQIISVERASDRVKVLGELVSIAKISERLLETLQKFNLHPQSVLILAIPHFRKGQQLIAVTDAPGPRTSQALKDLNDSLSAVEKIQCLYWLNEVPRSALGKAQKLELLKTLQISPEEA